MALTLRIHRGKDGSYSIVGLTDTEIERLAHLCANAGDDSVLASLSRDLRAIVGSARWDAMTREPWNATAGEREDAHETELVTAPADDVKAALFRIIDENRELRAADVGVGKLQGVGLMTQAIRLLLADALPDRTIGEYDDALEEAVAELCSRYDEQRREIRRLERRKDQSAEMEAMQGRCNRLLETTQARLAWWERMYHDLRKSQLDALDKRRHS